MNIQPVLAPYRLNDFDPRSLPGLQSWLRADNFAGFSDGDPVALWSDESGRGNYFYQDTLANKPTYKTNRINGRPSVLFATDDYLQAATMFMAAPTAWTIYVVKVSQIGSGGAIVGAFSFDVIGGWQYVQDGQIASVNDGIGSKSWTTAGLAEPVWRYFTSKFDGINIPIRVNGLQSGSQSNSGTYTGLSPMVAVSIGALVDATLFPPTLNNVLEGEIAEILMYDKAHSVTQMQLVETYIKSKFAL